MAFSTLATLRTGRLNPDLGLSADSDNAPFGDTTVRNNALKVALARLWPVMGRLQRETITIVSTTLEYTLTTLRDVEIVEQVHATAGVTNRVPKWQLIVDEAADPVVYRIRFEGVPESSTVFTYRAIGYAPYKSEYAADSESIDLPPRLEWIAVTGARVELYRRKIAQRVNFQQAANENRDTDVSMSELIAAYQLATREFDEAMKMNQRTTAGGRR